MSEEKQSRLSKLKEKMKMPKIQMPQLHLKEKASNTIFSIKRIFLMILPLITLALGFVVGARMHELGALEGVLGKDLKGATVKVSGPCLVNGEERNPALAEDEVKVTAVSDNNLIGVIRKTREVVRCKLSEVAIDKIPLLADFKKTPAQVPDLTLAEVRKKETPRFKDYENKVLLISGLCNDDQGLQLPAFTDEKVDVTSVEAESQGSMEFNLKGIRKSDKQILNCSSKLIKYEITDGSMPAPPPEKIPLTFLNKRITVTSKCVPDPRVPAPRGPDGRKIIFFRLVNSPVQVIEEVIENEKLVKFTGTIVDKKMDSAGFGQMIVCDSKTFPMTYEVLDEDTMDLDRPDSLNKNKELESGSGISFADEKKKEAKVLVKKTEAPVKEEQPKEVLKEETKENLMNQLEGESNGQQ